MWTPGSLPAARRRVIQFESARAPLPASAHWRIDPSGAVSK
jgi:hypothetical protein